MILMVLCCDYNIKEGVWGKIVVIEGELFYLCEDFLV